MNCGHNLKDDAKVCVKCEAPVEQPLTDEEIEAVETALGMMSDEARVALLAAFQESQTADEFVNRVMVGDCPACGSSEVGCCENDPEIADITVGRCYACGQLWCTFCDKPFPAGVTHCDCDPSDLEDEL
jgi:hypothetical protein